MQNVVGWMKFEVGKDSWRCSFAANLNIENKTLVGKNKKVIRVVRWLAYSCSWIRLLHSRFVGCEFLSSAVGHIPNGVPTNYTLF